MRETLLIYLMRIPAILFAISVHESAHAWVAYKLGDPTAKNAGRISLNPLRHLNPVGMIMMLLVGFGWASPVMINAGNFKKPKVGMAVSSLAGPLSNLLLGAAGMMLTVQFGDPSLRIVQALVLFFNVFISLNVSLAVFNLIPVPPLDGSRILLLFLPERIYFKIMRYEQYILIALIVLMVTNVITVPISSISRVIINGMFYLLSLPFRA